MKKYIFIAVLLGFVFAPFAYGANCSAGDVFDTRTGQRCQLSSTPDVTSLLKVIDELKATIVKLEAKIDSLTKKSSKKISRVCTNETKLRDKAVEKRDQENVRYANLVADLTRRNRPYDLARAEIEHNNKLVTIEAEILTRNGYVSEYCN